MASDPDLFLVIGLILAILAVPPIVGALSEGRAPRAASILVLVAGGLITLAVMSKPGGYSIEEVPGVVMTVVGRYI